MTPTLETTLTHAERLLPEFQAAVEGASFLRRGVHVSEVFFIRVAVGDHQPRQILESGRALGQSTWLLAKSFPHTPILSVELHPEHADADAALERLRPLANVACLFGDSRILLPAMALPGDVIVIDGPKEIRALKLAYRLLREKKPAMVFIHDCTPGTAIRAHLEKHCPFAFYSDHPDFIARYNHLDTYLDAQERRLWSDPATFPKNRAYGGTFACLPLTEGFPTVLDQVRLITARTFYNLKRSLRRRLERETDHEHE